MHYYHCTLLNPTNFPGLKFGTPQLLHWTVTQFSLLLTPQIPGELHVSTNFSIKVKMFRLLRAVWSARLPDVNVANVANVANHSSVRTSVAPPDTNQTTAQDKRIWSKKMYKLFLCFQKRTKPMFPVCVDPHMVLRSPIWRTRTNHWTSRRNTNMTNVLGKQTTLIWH